MHHRTLTGQTLSSGTIGLRSGVYDGKIAGLYDLEETLGRGHFAVVKLARHVFTGEKVAVKVIDKTKLDEVSKAHLFQEVRCMKLVQHPNVVRLYEVIDTATKLYLILELGDGGDLYDYIMRHDSGLSEQLAREYFRQIVRAISYCHQLHVVHRDLKPENVVFFEKLGVVKLTDFGFSNKFCPGQKLETSCGSLAYSAPEILLGDSYDAPAVDVWSLGVILYMLVCGQAPFQEANDSETLTMIMDCKYSIPSHVSKECRDLISRMLVRAPEKRATLSEIAAHPWLSLSKNDPHFDVLPLVSKEQLSDDDHNLIVQKIVNGNIATKEEIQECLDKNEYNHITATYFLLAERKLRSKRQEQVNKNRRPEHLNVPQIQVAPARDVTGPTPCLLSIPRTPGDLPQRSRKCSIVQEDEEEEDISSSGREELTPNHCSLNRRGSRSEGRLNLALQERLAEERRKQPERAEIPKHVPSKLAKIRNSEDSRPKSAKENVRGAGDDNNCKVKNKSSTTETTPKSLVQAKILKDMKPLENVTTTTVITGSSTITIPVVTNSTSNINQGLPKFKTMPSPTKTSVASPLQLNEIFEEGDSEMSRPTSRQFVSRNQNRTLYEQRRSKFHKNRTASCSSSDASDDDSENRKKRANKLSAPAKPLPGRRDSHDDSSDSQEPGTGTGTSGSNGQQITTVITQNTSNTVQNTQKSSNNSNSNNTGGRKNCNVIIGRRHKSSRRRTGETRLRESQSLNRITEVQEDTSHAIIISTTITANQSTVVPKVKGFGSKLLQNLSINVKRSELKEHQSRKDCLIKSLCLEEEEDCKDEKEYFSKLVTEKSTTKKIRLLGKYFHMHKKLCIPLPGIFNRNRLYKAQSCSSLARDKINVPRQRNVSVVGIGDVNQNRNDEKSQKSTVVQLNNVCNELTGICAIHLGQASKCCAFC